MVVVSTGHHGFAVARVANIHIAPEMRKKVKHNREVVCKADFTHFYARKDAVKKAIELKQNMEMCPNLIQMKMDISFQLKELKQDRR